MNKCFSLALGIVCVSVGICQAPTSPSHTQPVQEPAAKELKPLVFHSELLDIAFTFPGNMIAKPLPSADEQHAATAKNQPASENDAYKKADQCTDSLFSATRVDDPNASKVHLEIHGEGQGAVLEIEHPVKASILISRLGLECTPEEYRNRTDEMAQAMAESVPQEFLGAQDVRMIDQPGWYELGGIKTHFALAESEHHRAKEEGGDGISKADFIAGISFVRGRNLVLIVLESNDQQFLNELLHSEVVLGKQPEVQMFPADLGHGAPVKFAP